MQVELETIVLNSLMTVGETPESFEVIGKLTPDMFTNHFNRTCFEVIKGSMEQGEGVGQVDIADGLTRHGYEGSLNTLIEWHRKMAGGVGHLRGTAKKIRQNHLIRHTSAILDEAKTVTQSNASVGEIAAQLTSVLSNISLETNDRLPRSFDEIAKDYVEIVDKRLNGDESVRTIKTGIGALDEQTMGFNVTDLILIGAVPGMGKTELIVRMLRGLAAKDMGSLTFSLEMEDWQIVERAISGEGNLSSRKLRDPKGMTEEDYGKFAAGMGSLTNKPLYVLDQAGLTVDEIIAATRKHKREHPELAMVFIDHMGLMEVHIKETRAQALGDVSRKLKALAKEIKTPVVLLSQLNSKDIEKRPVNSRRPNNSDLKDSSRLTEDADWILFPYRHQVYDENAAPVAEIIIGKARHGEPATVYCGWKDGHFTDIDQATAYNEISRKQSGGGYDIL